jgi:hypothetical protein
VLLASSAKQEIRVRSGRDDKGNGRYGPQLRSRDWQNADLSTALRSGRDDKGEGRYGPQQTFRDRQTQISPLRFAPVEMTKGWVVMARSCGLGIGKTQISPLRFAPVEIVVARIRSCGNRTCRSVGSVAALWEVCDIPHLAKNWLDVGYQHWWWK